MGQMSAGLFKNIHHLFNICIEVFLFFFALIYLQSLVCNKIKPNQII